MKVANEELVSKVHDIADWLGTGSINLFGQPFAGKDVQAEKLGLCFDAPIIGGGVILRNSVIPPEVQGAMDRGELIPSAAYKAIVLPFLKSDALHGRPLLLSSVGRVGGEEVGVLEATAEAGHPIRVVPHIEIATDESFRRLSLTPDRNRADDTPNKLRVRLEEYEEKSRPVLAAYSELGLLLPVDGMQAESAVFNSLIHRMHDYINAAA